MAEKKLRGLLDRAQATIGGLLGDFPQGFNAGAVAGVAGYPGDIAYMLDTAGRAITGQDTQPAAQDFPGTTDYIAAKAGYPIPGSFSGQLGAAVGGMLTPGPGDLAKFAPVLSAIPFWHGSPHKYDAVDLSKIGTGEGAQAYGHGYYGADAKETALQYRNALSPTESEIDGKKLPLTELLEVNGMRGFGSVTPSTYDIQQAAPHLSRDEARAVQRAISHRGDMDAAISSLAKEPKAAEALKQMAERIKVQSSGNLYRGEYRWPDPAKEAATPLTGEDLLDWDKPLSEQNEAVKRFFEPYVAETRKALSTPGEAGWGELAAPINFDPTGNELLNILSRHVNPEHGKLTVNTVLAGGTGGSYTSEVLKNAGIPGIRYLDGVSRGAGEGTRNYVMFDDKGIKLLERNGEPIKAAEDFAARRAGKAKPYKEAMGFAPNDDALVTAQRNAAKPVEDGGLGLPPNNTPADRATAMGYVTDVYHGTINGNIQDLKPSDMESIFTDVNPEVANMYAGGFWTTPIAKDMLAESGQEYAPNVLPLKYQGKRNAEYSNVIDKNPAKFRSRFAVFDPFKRESHDLLAGLAALGIGLGAVKSQQDKSANEAK